MGQIFEGLVHPLKVVKIKNPFGIFQTYTQIPQEWGRFFLDALASLETTHVSQSVSKPQFRKSHKASASNQPEVNQ